MSEETPSLEKIVPQFYYDLIARIIPGSVFIAEFWKADTNTIDTPVFLAVLAASYLIGIIVDSFGSGIVYIIGFVIPSCNINLNINKIDKLSTYSKDQIKKLIAEQQLFINLSIICFVSAFCGTHIRSYPLITDHLIIFGIIFLVIFGTRYWFTNDTLQKASTDSARE